MALSDNTDFCINHSERSQPDAQIMKNSHLHDYYEIYYLLAGTRRYFINHTLYNLEPGDIILINKGDIHLTTTITSDYYHERYLLTFSDEFFERFSPILDTTELMSCFNTKKIHIPPSKRYTFEALLHKMFAEYQKKDEFSDYMAGMHLVELLVFLNRRAKQKAVPFDDITVHEERIQDVCRHICTYYNQPIALSDMAKMAYMSPTYFSKKFKKVTGVGFNEYLNNVRIKMASNMLSETQYSVTEIARLCGYKDSNYFGDVFKKIMGISPSKYRKNNYTF